MPDILFILLLALVVFGPKKLPQMAAQIGKYLAQFQQMKRELLAQVNNEVLRLEDEKKSVKPANDGQILEANDAAASVMQSTPSTG
jgi:sec-independent protein translocase protein TatB